MAGVLVSASTGVMNSVIGKLATLMGEEYKKHKSMQRDVAFLKDELASMNAVLSKLADMEEEHDPQTKDWRNQVMDMAFDIEDCVDEFMHHGGGDDADLGFVRKTTRRLKKLRARRQIANQMQELKARVKDVSERRQRYNLDECGSSSRYVAVDHRMPALYMEAANLVGMDGPKGELMKLLALEEEGVSIQCLKVVSIFWFGGLGKTALANSVYHQLRGQYDCKVFVSVSQKPDLMKLLSRIISKVTGMPQGAHIYEVQDLIDNLREYLKDKRYLFVIDDIWNESVWEILQCAFPDNQQGSKVITTTRIETVAKVCCNYHQEYIYKMKPLDNQNSQKLFFRRLGHVSSQPFKEVSDEILQKCGGLPLAILSIASLLASQPTGSIEQWKYVCSSLSSNLRTHPSLEGMRQILNLSYNHLPRHLKPCLLYIGMYPEDYSIVKKDLVKQWVAEGFVSKMQDRDAEEVAESYFNELINRSMIEPSEAEFNGEILKCKVHDMILDLIVFKSEEDNFLRVVDNQHSMNIALQCKVRRLSLHLDGTNQNTTLGKSLSHLRSLAIFGEPNVLLPVSELKPIRVLHRECWWGSTDDRYDLTPVCKLVHLRYLKIRTRAAVQMPTRMGALQCLETLELETLSGCINGIPSDIINLPHLLHLIVPSNTRLPDGIGNMKSLHTLRCFNVVLNTVNNLKGFSELTNLRDLELSTQHGDDIVSEHQQRNMDVVWFSIVKLLNCNLRCLKVEYNFGDPTPVQLSYSLTISQTQSHLDRLKVSSWSFPRIPKWICQFRKIYILELTVKKLVKDDIDVLGGLPALAFLWLWIQKAPEERMNIRGSAAAFPVLKIFDLRCSAPCLTFEAGAMPKLETFYLALSACGMDRYGTSILDGVEHLLSLKKFIASIYFEVDDIESVRTAAASAEAALRNAINVHPGHPSMGIYSTDRTTSLAIRDLSCDDSEEEEEKDTE